MNREIKFRAWIKPEVTQEDTGFMHYEEDKSDYCMVSNGCGFGIVVDHDKWAPEGSYEVMQYIGLKDKNGKKIYEEMEINNTSSVRFENGSYVLYSISSGDTIAILSQEFIYENRIEITGEYSKMEKD